MFRHIVLLTFSPDATDDQVSGIVDALRTLPGRIDTIRQYSVGVDAKINDGNAELCAVADFDDEAGYLVYRDHEAHRQVIAEHIAPVLAGRSAIQYEMDRA